MLVRLTGQAAAAAVAAALADEGVRAMLLAHAQRQPEQRERLAAAGQRPARALTA
jgi:hypothetical protein